MLHRCDVRELVNPAGCGPVFDGINTRTSPHFRKSHLPMGTVEHGSHDHQRAADGGKEIKMANHKRKRPKSVRAGCMMCKPWKKNAFKDQERSQTMQERRARVSEREQRREP